MTASKPDTQKAKLVENLVASPAETSWLEFETNNSDPGMIGKMISALSNAALLDERDTAYVLWGVRDEDRAVVGTEFRPDKKHKMHDLEFWLRRKIKPDLDFHFDTIDHHGARLVLLTIAAANKSPTLFDGESYIRIESATPRLSMHPELERRLWNALQAVPWEARMAMESLSGDEVLARLDYLTYFLLTKHPTPGAPQEILARLSDDKIIRPDDAGQWSITNLGAILFAWNLNDFSTSMAYKGIRFAAYDGAGRSAKNRWVRDEEKGYASGLRGMLNHIDELLPENEHLGTVIRRSYPLYPKVALREFIVNALIHQDMTITGAGPRISLFSDRLEISNPGKPLIPANRFLGSNPRSRNERLSSLMRRMGLCEERGTGVIQALRTIEIFQLPPPEFRDDLDAVRVTLFAPRSFAKMTRDERIRACYQHAALTYLSNGNTPMRNMTLCERFGIDKRNAAQASTVIKQTMEAGLVKPADPGRPRAGYVPFWA